jgi:hypothetical protein
MDIIQLTLFLFIQFIYKTIIFIFDQVGILICRDMSLPVKFRQAFLPGILLIKVSASGISSGLP